MFQEEFEGVFDVLFVGAPSVVMIEIVLVARTDKGELLYFIGEDETIYFPYNIISMKKIS